MINLYSRLFIAAVWNLRNVQNNWLQLNFMPLGYIIVPEIVCMADFDICPTFVKTLYSPIKGRPLDFPGFQLFCQMVKWTKKKLLWNSNGREEYSCLKCKHCSDSLVTVQGGRRWIYGMKLVKINIKVVQLHRVCLGQDCLP
jgi:hypothetical protein